MDTCLRDGDHSGKTHEFTFPIFGEGPVHEVKQAICEGHAAGFTLMPPLPIVNGECTCRICLGQ